MQEANKKTIFSGIQPSGNLHLGNYLGAIHQWVEMQDEYNCIFSIVDYHAITVKQSPEVLRKKIIETAKIYLASGINPEKAVIFQQSQISAHTELAWILNCVARMADLNKMTQFKAKAGDEKESATVGLYNYPVLMAADILLYNTDVVPVGEDQTQHVEFARTIARRFNQQFKNVFKVPEIKIKKESARIMGLDDPSNKMSKSSTSAANYIALTDKIEIAKNKIQRAQTDSGKNIIFDPQKKPSISNLLTIYSMLSGDKIKDLENKYQDKGYGDFKKDLIEVVSDFLTKFHTKFNGFHDEEVLEIMRQDEEKIQPLAEETLNKAKEAIGVK